MRLAIWVAPVRVDIATLAGFGYCSQQKSLVNDKR
jgi:hypothetical protein